MMTGSMGYGRVESMTAKLVEQTGEDTHLYILGGTNEELKKTLRDTYADTERVHVLDLPRKRISTWQRRIFCSPNRVD